jgi:hypothetical protein
VIIVRFADDIVVGFQHRFDAERFQADLVQRFARFNLELNTEKTRLIEFGRFAAQNRRRRGLGRPETFGFLGFTHLCGKTRAGRFALRRKTIAKRMAAKLREVNALLEQRRHWPVPEQGQWLGSVVRGHLAYYAVPGNIAAVSAFRKQVTRHWGRSLRRRSQRHRVTWERMGRLEARWLVGARYSVTSCDLPILMDQSTESISPHDPPSRQDSSRFDGPERRHLAQGAVRTVHVVVIGVLGQHRHQLPTSEDEHPVQQLPANRAHPALRVGVRPRCPDRRAQHLDPLSGKDSIECGGELDIPITEHKPELADAVLKGHEQVAGLLCHPLPYWMRCHPEHMDPAGRDLDRKQHIQPPQQDRLHGEEVHRQHTGSLSA